MGNACAGRRQALDRMCIAMHQMRKPDFLAEPITAFGMVNRALAVFGLRLLLIKPHLK